MDENPRKDNTDEEINHDGEQEDKDIVATNFNAMGPTVGSADPNIGPLDPAQDPDSTRNEEIADELTADDYDGPITSDDDVTETGTNINSAVGWIALILSAVSFFIMPIILGGAGIVVGFISRSRGATTLGTTAIIAGAVSILISLFVLPYV